MNFVELFVSFMSVRFCMICRFSKLDLNHLEYCNIDVVLLLSNGMSEVTYGWDAMIYFPFGCLDSTITNVLWLEAKTT